ncbi:tetratricopeptide repeat protein, partial [archaeon]
MKGNECYRAQDLEASLTHYLRSLALRPNSAAVFANRALCYLKREPPLLDLAEVDCTMALALDPCYNKAQSRRGLTRFK